MFDKQLLALPGIRRVLVLLAVAAVAQGLLVAGMAMGVGFSVAIVWEAGELEPALPYILLIGGCFAGEQFVKFARTRGMQKFAGARSQEIARKLAEAIYDGGPRFVSRHGTGSTASALVEGIDAIRSYIEGVLPKTIDLMVEGVLLVVALLAFDWLSALIVAVVFPCVTFFMRLLGSMTKEKANRQHRGYERLSNYFVDTLRGMRTFQLLGSTEEQAQKVYAVSERFRIATNSTLKTAMLSSLVLDLFRTFALAAVSIMLGFRLMAGWMWLGNALAVLVIVAEFFAVLRRYSADYHATLEGKNQLAAINAMLADAPAKISASHPELADPIESLELVNVSFAYGDDSTYAVGGTANSPTAESIPAVANLAAVVSTPSSPADDSSTVTKSPALHNVCLSIAGQESVGLIGTSGAGKTTLARILAGFDTPSSGQIIVNGKSYQSLACPEWLERVAYIPQEPHIFNATLRDNVAFYRPEASDVEISDALEKVGLGQLKSTLQQGLDTMLGEGSRQLSGGQSHRIVLARALVDPRRDVLVFDEPTAHLDIETELALKEQMLPLFSGRLVIFATHRLHWTANMDEILVMDNGQVVQQLRQNELANAGGEYARLSESLRGGGDSNA